MFSFQSLTPQAGTISSATGGTILNATGGTILSAVSGTISALSSVIIGIKHSGDENGYTTICQGYILIS